jgi:cytochrome c-type biogenesis protein CcsB
MQKSILSILFFCLLHITLSSQKNTMQIDKDHASKFGKLIVQDHRGRCKPVNTLCNEVMRKIAKKEALYGMNAEQIILSMMNNPVEWEKKPIIQVPMHPQIQSILGTSEPLISYISFFSQDGQYKFKEQIRNAQTMNPKDQGTFEKSIIKLDEKVNIVNMIFSGKMLRLFPQPNDATNTWISPADLVNAEQPMPQMDDVKDVFLNYLQAINTGSNTSNFAQADAILNQLSNYQKINGAAVYPSESKIAAELVLNKLDFFGRLRNYYGMLSLCILGVFLFVILKQSSKRAQYTKYAFWAMAAGFVFHTIGLALRWYVSGRAPWSNGYESMIYIGWTTMLAGTLFSRKSLGGLAATATLAATILLVAGMSWLDPEITPLVPVLKSYWLTIHVSLEAGSYGFLMLGAVIGMLNLLLITLINEKNKSHITKAVNELTIISEITLLGGLFMVSVGTYLGGVWANESWGRYWGWDAKETWALVTILVYAFILHMRFIPGLQSVFAFNFASLFGFATVIMTYFGVNYYLSGLHSYAAGDPVPIPPQVYYTTICLSILSIVAYWSYKKKMA